MTTNKPRAQSNISFVIEIGSLQAVTPSFLSFAMLSVFLKKKKELTVNILKSLVLCVNCAVTLGSNKNKKNKKKYGKLFHVCGLSALCMLACE